MVKTSVIDKLKNVKTISGRINATVNMASLRITIPEFVVTGTSARIAQTSVTSIVFVSTYSVDTNAVGDEIFKRGKFF